MNLKQSLCIPATPVALAQAHPVDQLEEQYLERLGHSMQEVLASLHATAHDYSEKYVRREECERLLEQKHQTIMVLQGENYQLRLAAQQFQRCLKRSEMKQELLNNKVYHLTKAIAEKDAIIKYLEGKALPVPQPTPPPVILPARNANDSLHEVPRTYSKSNLSFAKLKSTPTLMTFEDYANSSLQLPSDPTKRIKGERIKTESSDVKQNEPTDNIGGGMNKLVGFFSSGMFGSVENQKTLTKAQPTATNPNASFWQYSKTKPEGREQRRHSNFSSYMAQPHPHGSFYRE